MGKKATKAAGNMYCMARYEAAGHNPAFSSREKTGELLGMDRTRLANIELGNLIPYPEEVLNMAHHYNTPELCNAHCAEQCPIGKNTVKKVQIDDFDRLSLKVLGSLNDIDHIRDSLIAISEDGIVSNNEREQFLNIIASLEKIAGNANALKIWAEKNIRFND